MLRPHGWNKLLGVSQRLLHQSDRGVCSAPHLLTAGVALQTASGSDSGQSLTPWSSCYYMQWLWRLGWSECILHTRRKTVLRHRVPSTWSKFPLIKNKLKRSRKSVWAVSMVSKVLPCLPVTIPAASDRTKRMISVCASCQSTCIAVLVCSVSIRGQRKVETGLQNTFRRVQATSILCDNNPTHNDHNNVLVQAWLTCIAARQRQLLVNNLFGDLALP